MLLAKRKHLPIDSQDWAFELKYDGWRLLEVFAAGRPTENRAMVRRVRENE